ncbi:putative Subtilisin-type proteinase [[Clostridium] ultunense Esp]|nr:putative Subtilisin-type proteinase [[Clostridium] ultunense Esp]
MSRTVKRGLSLSLIVLLLLLTGGGVYALSEGNTPMENVGRSGQASLEEKPIQPPVNAIPGEWIVKWRGQAKESPYYEILDLQEKFRTGKVRFYPKYQKMAEEILGKDPDILYFQPNTRVKVEALFNDPGLGNQSYLRQTKLDQAMAAVSPNPNLTVAIIDTGVDFTHPDLKGNLLPGFNLLEKGASPADDNGHGTQLAGVIGATRDNKIGIAGILSGVRILPIKALDNLGSGDAYTVAAGIRQAVDRGAKIIMLSLSDPSYSKDMEDAVRYAEGKGVLLVAAAGNNGERVSYPAAYPTVLAVGSVGGNNQVSSFSNRGPELDVVAPGEKIYTTFLGGDYGTATGTSLAVPQVAGLAGLIMSKYPDYTPAQVRDLIRHSALDVNAKGWDQETGYGLIDGMKSLTNSWQADYWEPNDQSGAAKRISINKEISANLSSATDVDWFVLQTPYKGKYTFTYRGTGREDVTVRLSFYQGGSKLLKRVDWIGSGSVEVPVVKEALYVKVEALSPVTSPFPYILENRFHIYGDDFEPNNSRETAKEINLAAGKLTGTISFAGDVDWYRLSLPYDGKVTIQVNADTVQLDPVLRVIPPGGDERKVDNGSITSPQPEEISLNVKKGTLLIGVENFYGQAVNAEYLLTWSYTPLLKDTFEPNNSPLYAKGISLGVPVYGHIGSLADYDWFKFSITQAGFYRVDGSNFPKGSQGQVILYNGSLKEIGRKKMDENSTTFSMSNWLEKGTYYFRIDAAKSFTNQLYRLVLWKVESAFRDIGNHWAFDSINTLAKEGLITGYSDLTFRPNQPITRAEFLTLLSRVIDLPPGSRSVRSPFRDVSTGFWAYPVIISAYQKGLIGGYADGSFRPNAPLTRAEMSAMVARGLKIKPAKGSDKMDVNPYLAVYLFKDIPLQYWANEEISFLIQLRVVEGYENGVFKPEKLTTRAEMAALVERIWF